jgi:polysaccharide export outer membrane protein
MGAEPPKLGTGASDPVVEAPRAAPEGAKKIAEKPSPDVRRTVDLMTAPATPGNNSYKIGPLDVVDISVFKVPELSKSVQVSEVGSINYPLLGEVQAAGLTARDLERSLTGALGAKYLQKPQVTVFVKEFNSQRITLEGAIKKPGVYPIQGGLTLLQAVAIAQGLETSVSDGTAVIFRNASKQRTIARFDIDSIKSGEATDPPLQAGDVIVIGTSASKEALNNVLKVLPLASVFRPF